MAAVKKAAPKRRSSKRAPMTLAAVRRFLDDGITTAEYVPRETVRVTVPMKKKSYPLGLFFVVLMEDAHQNVFLRLPSTVSVPKDRVNDALKLLRRLHELS